MAGGRGADQTCRSEPPRPVAGALRLEGGSGRREPAPVLRHGGAKGSKLLRLPGHVEDIPRFPEAVPGHAAALPCFAEAVPDSTSALPRSMAALPSQAAAVRRFAAALPSEGEALRRLAAAVPSHGTALRRLGAALPGPGEVVPRSAQALLRYGEALPCSAVPVPRRSDRLRGAGETVRGDSGGQPGTFSELPGRRLADQNRYPSSARPQSEFGLEIVPVYVPVAVPAHRSICVVIVPLPVALANAPAPPVTV